MTTKTLEELARLPGHINASAAASQHGIPDPNMRPHLPDPSVPHVVILRHAERRFSVIVTYNSRRLSAHHLPSHADAKHAADELSTIIMAMFTQDSQNNEGGSVT